VPDVGTSNLVLQPGDQGPQEMIGQVANGLHVLRLYGMHTVNPVSGDFSLGISGHWIRDGALAEPVRELTVAGNLVQLLRRVRGLASDLRFIFAGGFCGSPSLLIEELAVAGN
jgi:PmbA protein